MPPTPKDAAAIILLKDPADPKVFWVKRNPKLTFMGGFHAFPGGQLDPQDAAAPVINSDGDSAPMRACAVREFFEETGVLLACGRDFLSDGIRTVGRKLITESSDGFNRFLREHVVQIDGSQLIPAGRWVTPPFAPRRFDTWFFLAWLPDGQEPSVEPGELVMGEWVRPTDALAKWHHDDVILAPPTLHILRTLAAHSHSIAELPARLTALPEAQRGVVRRIEFRPGIFLFPVKTATLPPATHTNCYVVGGDEMIVIDPASPYEEEQLALDAFLDSLLAEGRSVREIFLTHHHRDHVGGVNHLRDKLGVPVAAHRLTAERLAGTVVVDRYVDDGELIEIAGEPGWRLQALHTPGHARGHLCIYEEITGAIITGDNVVGLGTVVIDPPEGNMQQYFDSLRRLLELPRLTCLFGAHGPAIGSARHKIEEYVAHRTMRESKILGAVRAGAETPSAIVEAAYTDVSPSLYWLAERSTLAHLEKLEAEGRVIKRGDSRYRAA
ncbi:MAG TPA: MBL fold metallo-hydrolase [Blastocatellia bacterium]|nr:MBL fold metallo-hydrolase [Blastocatellia bacterium]